MKFCDERIQKHLLSGGKIKRNLGTCEIILHINNIGYIYNEDDCCYAFNESDLTADNWEIIEPEYNWNKIIKDKILCVFSHQENFEYKAITTLDRRDKQDGTYFTSQEVRYSHCKPFNPADFNIAKDLKEYEK